MKEAKYKIADPVWFIGDREVTCERIDWVGAGGLKSCADGTYEPISFKYKLYEVEGVFREEDLYTSKEALIENL